MKSQCPRSEPPCPKPPPHQMLPDSDQLRPATAIRSSSGHPPGAPLPQQYVSASAASSHIQGGSLYPRQQASVQRPMRPPLPSYNQALAMKQQQMPSSAFPVMSGAHESPQSTHMLPNANSGISSRDLKPS
uniref:Uncharacterized protein n=1 Tax=Schistocephalus solidus TaxID=70667 RepID=A0A0X3NMC2_SCHSO